MRVIAVVVAVLVSGCARPSADEHLARGQQYLADGQLQAAIIEFRNVIQIDPQHGAARRKLAEAYLRANDGENARREYVRAADLLPADAGAQIEAGNVLLLARAFEDALARATTALTLDPTSVNALILKGNALAGLKNLDGAIAEYEQALALDPSFDRAYVNLGVLQFARGETDDAEEAFTRAVAMAPSSVQAHLALANFYWASQRLPEAEHALNLAVAADTAGVAAHRAIGTFYMATGRGAEAEPHIKAIAEGGDPAAKLTLALYYVTMNRMADARGVLEPLSRHPDVRAQAVVRLAALDAIEGLDAAALARVRELLVERPSDVSALILASELLRKEGRRAEAMTMVESAIKADPTSSVVHLLEGRLHADADRLEDAKLAFEEALRLEGRPFAALLDLARLHLLLGAADRARDYAQQAVTLAPGNTEAHHLLARALLLQRDLAGATREVEWLRKASPTLPTTFTLQASVDMVAGRAAAARAAYTRALELDDANLEALEGLTALDLASGRRAEATSRIDNALARREPSVDLLMLAARTYAAAGRSEDTERLLREAIDLDADRLQAYVLLGQFYASQGRLKDATAQFQDVAAKNPKSVGSLTIVGMLLEAQGLTGDAEQQYLRTLALDSSAPVAANNLAYIYVSTNRSLDEALALAQRAQQRLPNEPNVSDTLGWIYVKKNLAASALPHLQASVKALPQHPEVHYHLGMAYMQSGDFSRAKQSLERALALSTTFTGAEEARKALVSVGG